jgi:hypothetical protein
MSAQTISEVFAPIEARYRAEVMADTWGHLAPKRNKTYKGHIVFAVGCFGDDPLNPTVLSCDFKGLDDSPWFFDAMADFIGEDENRGSEGNVYRFDGVFRNYEFSGTIRQVFAARAK